MRILQKPALHPPSRSPGISPGRRLVVQTLLGAATGVFSAIGGNGRGRKTPPPTRIGRDELTEKGPNATEFIIKADHPNLIVGGPHEALAQAQRAENPTQPDTRLSAATLAQLQTPPRSSSPKLGLRFHPKWDPFQEGQTTPLFRALLVPLNIHRGSVLLSRDGRVHVSLAEVICIRNKRDALLWMSSGNEGGEASDVVMRKIGRRFHADRDLRNRFFEEHPFDLPLFLTADEVEALDPQRFPYAPLTHDLMAGIGAMNARNLEVEFSLFLDAGGRPRARRREIDDAIVTEHPLLLVLKGELNPETRMLHRIVPYIQYLLGGTLNPVPRHFSEPIQSIVEFFNQRLDIRREEDLDVTAASTTQPDTFAPLITPPPELVIITPWWQRSWEWFLRFLTRSSS